MIDSEYMKHHDQIMSDLAAKHDVLLTLLQNSKVHYLDLPMHGNVGDLLIMHGTLKFFKRHNIKIKQYSMYFNYSPKLACAGDVIVLHGGGNFGDIYGPFQKFREKVIAALPSNKIIILPQTIHFQDQENFEVCKSVFSRHKDLHICARDTKSFEIAKQLTDNVYLLPDMAHQLWPLDKKNNAESKEVLRLKRRDSEAPELKEDYLEASFDWEDLIGPVWEWCLPNIMQRSMYHFHNIFEYYSFANIEAKWWIYQSEKFIERAIKLFSQYEKVESNRLHAHILSSLLSIPNEISDNSYGKNSSYIKLWTAPSDIVTLTQS